jgi:hypothetical protein
MRLEASLRRLAYLQSLIVGVFILGALGCTAISAPKFGASTGGSSGAAGSGGAGPGVDAGQREAGGDGPGSLGDGKIATDGMKDAPSVGDGPGGGNGGGGSGGGAGGNGGGAGGKVPDAAVDYPALIPDALSALGATCSANGACASGICADAVCCDKTCTGCNACTQTLTGEPDGTCGFVTSGLSAHNACTDQTKTNQCGNDGTCDGAGACRNVSTSHVCTDSSCNGSVYTPISTCDGKGACTVVNPQDCAPFTCAQTGCSKTCTTAADCEDPTTYYCDATTKTCAAKLSNGKAASSGTQCTSTVVADGVCCDKDCTGCSACTKTLNGQTDGQCLPVPAGNVGHNTCTAANTTCGTTGMCDGAGKCQYGANGTKCGSACTGATLTPKTCDGAGNCNAGTPTSCGLYVCASTGDICGGTKGPGSACSGASECDSGFCADSVCCNRACTGSCEACDVAASPGTCTTLAANASPRASRTACLGSTAPCAGKCNGASAACFYASSSTPCGSASCNANNYQAVGSCNSSGSCVMPDPQACPDGCVATSGCTGTCHAGDVQCSSGGVPQVCSSAGSWQNQTTGCTSAQYCASGACTSKGGNGDPCQSNGQCTSANCSNSTCCATGQTACSGVCVSLSSNTNCGSCGRSCGTGSTCSGGNCYLNNGQSCTTGSQCLTGTCSTFYQDIDGDTYGSNASIQQCGTTVPAGYANRSGDCCDTDANAKPGQTNTYSTADNCSSFDYNCDGHVTIKVNLPADGSCGAPLCSFSPSGVCQDYGGCTCIGSDGLPTCDTFSTATVCGAQYSANHNFCQQAGPECFPFGVGGPAPNLQECN